MNRVIFYSFFKEAVEDPQLEIYASARTGDSLDLSIADMMESLNAIGFACVNDAYNPSLITVGDPLTINNRELIIDPIKKYIDRHSINKSPEIKITLLGEDVVIYGALAKIVYQPST